MKTTIGKASVARAGWALLAVCACFQFALNYVWTGQNHFLDFAAYSNGLERLPYQNRILMSWIMRWLYATGWVQALMGRLASHIPIEVRDPYVLILLGCNLAWMLIAVFATRASLVRLTGNVQFSEKACLLVLGMVATLDLFLCCVHYSIPYDLASLALFCVGLWSIIAERPWALSAIFFIGSLNRETYIFITVYFLLYELLLRREGRTTKGGMRMPTVAVASLVQVAIWVAERLWLQRRFANNPRDGSVSDLFLLQLGKNLHTLANPLQLPMFVCLAAFLALPILAAWKRGPRPLVRATAIVAALWCAGMILVGVITEARVFTELIAFLGPCLAMAFWQARSRMPPAVSESSAR
jgi:hypothetical protein